MMVRLIAFALNASERLEFGRGLSNEEEPALWRKSLSGEIELWIDVGHPDERRLRKASGVAAEVKVYCYGERASDLWWRQNEAGLARLKNLSVAGLQAPEIDRLVQRTMRLQCTVEGGYAWLSSDEAQCEISVTFVVARIIKLNIKTKHQTRRSVMKDFKGKLAVITGGGTGMGRELARQLSAEGCHVAMCDVSEENMRETQRLCEAGGAVGAHLTTFRCDVSDEAQVLAFRDHVLRRHETDHINLLFNNAGIGGGGSFLIDDRAEWERTFGVCWYGVYYGSRAFMPLLVASTEGYIVNTSSVNGFWATLGPMISHTAYSAAKFAVKGFSEALVTDLRLNAPHVKVAVVMPGHIGTSIAINTGKVLGRPAPKDMSAADIAVIRKRMVERGMPVGNETDDQIRAALQQQALGLPRQGAAHVRRRRRTIILDGVRNDRWRILVGDDAHTLDRMVREAPEQAYEVDFLTALRGQGHLNSLTR